MSMCHICKNRAFPWSEKLTNEGWVGCVYYGIVSDIDPQQAINGDNPNVEAEQAALGWITKGGMSYNEMLLTKNTSHCSHFNYDED